MSRPARAVEPIAYDLREAATAMNLNSETVRRMLVSGELVGRKAGRGWRVSVDAIRAWLNGDAK
jgi:excisionase family DNA binding protein